MTEIQSSFVAGLKLVEDAVAKGLHLKVDAKLLSDQAKEIFASEEKKVGDAKIRTGGSSLALAQVLEKIKSLPKT